MFHQPVSMSQHADILQVSGVQELDSWHTEAEQPAWQARLSPTYNFHVLRCVMLAVFHQLSFLARPCLIFEIFQFFFHPRGRSVKIAILSEELSLQESECYAVDMVARRP